MDKTKRFEFRLTEGEKCDLALLAQLEGRSQAAYLRRLIYRAAVAHGVREGYGLPECNGNPEDLVGEADAASRPGAVGVESCQQTKCPPLQLLASQTPSSSREMAESDLRNPADELHHTLCLATDKLAQPNTTADEQIKTDSGKNEELK